MYITIKTISQSFVTDPDRWLGKSGYFRNLFSGNWGDKQDDGSYFIETDPQVFEHVLQYLRTGVLPIFFDSAKGHDFALYHSILQEAQYFDIIRLQKWLLEKKYLEAVKVRHVATELQERARSQDFSSDNDVIDRFMEGHADVSIVPVIKRSSYFSCPYGSHQQSTGPCSCLRRANEQKFDIQGSWKTEDHLKWCMVRKEIQIDHELCVNAYLEDDT